MIDFTGKQTYMNDNVIIVFTREPEAGKTKTRLMPYFNPEQCAHLHRCMLRDIFREVKKADADIVVAYSCDDGKEPAFLTRTMGRKAVFIRQRGADIGAKMQNAIDDALRLGYRKAVLMGTDIPDIEAETIDTAFSLLDVCDTVIGPTEDGGYYLIGMKAVHPEAFNVKAYGISTVFDETVASLKDAGLAAEKADTYADIDTPDDIAAFRRRMRDDMRIRRSHTGRFLAETARISVVVPVYNEEAMIGRLARQLIQHRGECEIIVVDGGSADSTLRILQDINKDNSIRILNAGKGRAVQMNAGAKASAGDILFFLHCDSILPDRFTDEIRKVMASYDWGYFKVKFPSYNFFMMTNRIFSNCRASFRKMPFGDQGIFIDRDLFFRSGMFPEIPLMEDYEFSRRMRCRKGIKGPGSTGKWIISSARRYGAGTMSILKTEIKMWKLRHLYRRGVSADLLDRMYDDIR